MFTLRWVNVLAEDETSGFTFIQRSDPPSYPHFHTTNRGSGDSLYAYMAGWLGLTFSAHKYGVSTYQLALVNEATISENCDNLQPDQEICLGIEGHDCTKVYTVVPDE